jgi:hypothetical protein
MKIVLNLFFALVFAGLACAGPAAVPSSEKMQPSSSGTALSPIKGTILETMDAAGYTYMRLKTSTGETWAAVQKASVKKGSEVTVLNPIPMDGFESKTLKRKFDRIVFGSLARAGAASSDSPAGAGAASSPLAPGHSSGMEKSATLGSQHAGVSSTSLDGEKIKVKKAEGATGKTVAEIYAGKASLKDAPVVVRGKVVKYSPGIMGKNWIHLRDGSGSPEKKNNDLTVTTLDTAAVGDVVLVKGKVYIDRDFGSGYSYPVILEDGKVSK